MANDSLAGFDAAVACFNLKSRWSTARVTVVNCQQLS